jgi:hypothetical protein
MKKIILATIILIFTLQTPSYANSCNINFAYPKISYKKNLNYTVVFVKYANSSGISHKNLIDIVDFKETARYIKKESNNRANVKFNIVKKTFTINNSYEYLLGMHSVDWLAEENKFFSHVISATDPSVDYSKSDGVIIIPDYNQSSLAIALRDPQIADGRALYGVGFNFSSPHLLAHEILHTLGLRDLYLHQTNEAPIGRHSLMSLGQMDEPLLNYEKYSIGWINDQEVTCHTSGTRNLDLKKKNSTLVVPISSTEVIVAEYKKSRVLTYYINSNIPSGRGPISILGNLKNNQNIQYGNINIKHIKNGVIEVYG